MEVTKTCRECGTEQSADCFHRDKSRIDGLAAYCKTCCAEKQRAYRRQNRQRLAEAKRAYAVEHADEIAARQRRYRAEHADELKASKKAWYDANRDTILARHREYWRENRERLLESAADYYRANKPRLNAYRRQWYSDNRAHCAALTAAWKREHPDLVYESNAKRRAQKRGADGSHTKADALAQFARQQGRCYWCGEKMRGEWHTDHVVPLSLGGSDAPENLVAACVSCNLSKHSKHPMDYAGVMF